MTGKANYAPLYVSADEIDDVDKLAERAKRILETAHGFYISPRTYKDAAAIDPVRLALVVQISQKLGVRDAVD